MILTANKFVKDWREVLAGDELMITALLDWLSTSATC